MIKLLFILIMIVPIMSVTVADAEVPINSITGLEVEDYMNIHVEIEDMTEYTKKIGLSRDLVKSKVELLLHQYGLNPIEEFRDEFLYIRITMVKNICNIKVNFKRPVITLPTYNEKYLINGTIVWEKEACPVLNRSILPRNHSKGRAVFPGEQDQSILFPCQRATGQSLLP